jgi:C4-dicarboxylate transporter, DctM subunit
VLAGGGPALNPLGSLVWNNVESFVLTAVPLFLFMGEIILRSGISRSFYDGITSWFGRLRGGLLHCNIVACAIFAAVTGSSVATAAAIGTVAIPEMNRRGYQPRMTLGSLAGGGTLGILIPPSIVMIIYGALVEESVARLFIAGVIPGLVMVGLFLGYIFVRLLLQPGAAPPEERPAPWRVRLAGLVVLGPIVGAQILSYALVRTGINREPTEWVVGFDLSRWALFAVITVIYIVLGFFVDGISMTVLTLPILYPIIVAAGFDPIWFGVVLVVLIELGQITPPMGLNIFVIQGISGESLLEVVRGVWPYAVLMLLAVLLLALFPGLATWLPAQMVGP